MKITDLHVNKKKPVLLIVIYNVIVSRNIFFLFFLSSFIDMDKRNIPERYYTPQQPKKVEEQIHAEGK